jgi:hypothetical protein
MAATFNSGVIALSESETAVMMAANVTDGGLIAIQNVAFRPGHPFNRDSEERASG